MSRSDKVAIEVDEDMLRKLEDIPDRRSGPVKLEPTPTQVEILRRGWKTKRKADISKLLGVHDSTARRWYVEYVEEKHD